jgi:hypothetical protein
VVADDAELRRAELTGQPDQFLGRQVANLHPHITR